MSDSAIDVHDFRGNSSVRFANNYTHFVRSDVLPEIEIENVLALIEKGGLEPQILACKKLDDRISEHLNKLDSVAMKLLKVVLSKTSAAIVDDKNRIDSHIDQIFAKRWDSYEFESESDCVFDIFLDTFREDDSPCRAYFSVEENVGLAFNLLLYAFHTGRVASCDTIIDTIRSIDTVKFLQDTAERVRGGGDAAVFLRLLRLAHKHNRLEAIFVDIGFGDKTFWREIASSFQLRQTVSTLRSVFALLRSEQHHADRKIRSMLLESLEEAELLHEMFRTLARSEIDEKYEYEFLLSNELNAESFAFLIGEHVSCNLDGLRLGLEDAKLYNAEDRKR